MQSNNDDFLTVDEAADTGAGKEPESTSIAVTRAAAAAAEADVG